MIRILLALSLLALGWASPASASFLYRYGGNFSYPATGNCDTALETHDGTDYRYASCDIGEAFHTTVAFFKDSANSWAYQVQWESDSATTDFACWTVQAAAFPDGTTMTAAVTENSAAVPNATGDANQAADTRQVTAWSAATAVRNADTDTNCTGTPSACEHAEVRLIVTRVACAADDLAGAAKVRAVIADTNP